MCMETATVLWKKIRHKLCFELFNFVIIKIIKVFFNFNKILIVEKYMDTN